jgi:hypothetical protein
VWLEGLGKLKKSTSSGTRTGDFPDCSIVHATACPHDWHVHYIKGGRTHLKCICQCFCFKLSILHYIEERIKNWGSDSEWTKIVTVSLHFITFPITLCASLGLQEWNKRRWCYVITDVHQGCEFLFINRNLD